jgi:hypothetical protein
MKNLFESVKYYLNDSATVYTIRKENLEEIKRKAEQYEQSD